MPGFSGDLTGAATPQNLTLPVQLSYQYDAMGRLSGITTPNAFRFNGSNTVASGAGYGAAGELTNLSYLGVNETRTYNSLGQLTGIANGQMNMGTRTRPTRTTGGSCSPTTR